MAAMLTHVPYHSRAHAAGKNAGLERPSAVAVAAAASEVDHLAPRWLCAPCAALTLHRAFLDTPIDSKYFSRLSRRISAAANSGLLRSPFRRGPSRRLLSVMCMVFGNVLKNLVALQVHKHTSTWSRTSNTSLKARQVTKHGIQLSEKETHCVFGHHHGDDAPIQKLYLRILRKSSIQYIHNEGYHKSFSRNHGNHICVSHMKLGFIACSCAIAWVQSCREGQAPRATFHTLPGNL
jgi:hypothetical protein